ncbi:MAG: serine/threonine protein kinase [Alphaproteobacteria bacterium]|nr:serine/threonine protein kinase [Alphaproteobacteria bacterium]MCB9691686.1 serine/threonine protein kinase [Alphaproteobacteria bacterium]
MSAGRRRFRIIKEIAEGGFGKVYLAEQISSDGFSRIVAVKLLHAKWSSHDEVVMRTRDEARLLGLIRHQHIVKVEDLTSLDGKCAIVMEYLEGCDLKWMISFLQERGLDFPRAALFEIILAVASALDAAYNGVPLQGGQPLRVIHRDIKPSNIFVTVAGGVKVLDFGTARANFAEREAKTQALAFGSQGYMAPERMLGEEDTPAADIFSLGVALYEILALESFGRIPPRPTKFAAKVEERVRSIPLSGDPEWCDQVRDTLRLMLSYEADDRPTAAQLVEIMELLAQDANDMGLRRFCRTLVAEAKAHLPEAEGGDPLAGRIVEEDASFGQSRAVAETYLDDDTAAPPTERMRPAEIAEMMRREKEQQASGETPTAHGQQQRSSPHARKKEPTGAHAKVPLPADEGKGSGLAFLMAGGGFVLVGIGAAVVVILVLLVVLVMYSGDSGGVVTVDPPPVPATPKPTPDPAPEPTPDPAPPGPEPAQPTPEPAQPAPAGAPAGVTVDEASPGGAKVGLEMVGGPADILIRGPGSKYTWDGAAPIELDLSPGLYRTIVKAGGRTLRKNFEVAKGPCAFKFDGEDWAGGCK